MKIDRFTSEQLDIDNFEVHPGQAWAVLGANQSGIETFFSLVTGQIRDLPASIRLPRNLGIFSFKHQQDLFEQELKKDETDFLDRIDPGTPARAFLKNPDAHWDLIRALALAPVLDKGFRQLSTGQSRKLLLLAQITRGKTFLAIQSPYDGLDPQSCTELNRALALCHARGIRILVLVHNRGDIPDWATHLGVITQGRLALSGPRHKVLDRLESLSAEAPAFKASVHDLVQDRVHEPIQSRAASPGPDSRTELVRLKNGTAGYQGKPVFTGIDLVIAPFGHTLVSGPNGSGKSTLVSVLTGNHPACYTNDLCLFGIQRGTGESIWELKKEMGIVSPDLHRNYYVPGTTLDCVLSGLFDSIGLYRPHTRADEEKALAWLARTGLEKAAHAPFRSLSFADQRLALIARALIKLPRLLILDEPTQGLDQANRTAVLDFLEGVAKKKLSTILYVSHRRDEFRPFFTSHIRMGQTGTMVSGPGPCGIAESTKEERTGSTHVDFGNK